MFHRPLPTSSTLVVISTLVALLAVPGASDAATGEADSEEPPSDKAEAEASSDDDSDQPERASEASDSEAGSEAKNDDDADGGEETSSPDGWAVSFEASSLPDELTDRKLLVAAAGNELEEAGVAASALRGALNEAGAPLVMDGDSLQEIAELGDQEIVEAATDLPVEAIVVVRVFVGGPTPTAVVAAYESGGEAITGFNVRKGESMGGDPSGGTSSGVSGGSVEGIESAPPETSDDGAQGRRRFDFSTTDEWRLVDRQNDETYTGADIYLQLGYPEFADDYVRRRRLNGWLVAGGIFGTLLGGAGVGTGIAMLIPGPECESEEYGTGFENCPSSLGHQPVAGGYTIFFTGQLFIGSVVTMIVGATRKIHPVSVDRVEQMIKENSGPHSETEGRAEGRSHRAARRRSGPGPARIGWTIVPTDGGIHTGIGFRW